MKYDPAGNRIWKQSDDGQTTTTRKYVVDVVGDLPVILLEIKTSDSTVKKTYIWANGQMIAQHNGKYDTDRFFYLHDRLGSVRLIIDTSANVERRYTYKSFGGFYDDEVEEAQGAPSNAFCFTGQYLDSEIGQYYMRARQYDPVISRFTTRDPVFGKFRESMTLHPYLYCLNDPVNRIDPDGRISFSSLNALLTGTALYAHAINLATYGASSQNWKFFELSFATLKFMPVGMAAGSISPSARFLATGLVGGLALEEILHITGMGRLEGIAMAPYAYFLYCMFMKYERAELAIFADEWQDFLEWRGPW